MRHPHFRIDSLTMREISLLNGEFGYRFDMAWLNRNGILTFACFSCVRTNLSLHKNPSERPTYSNLLAHPFIQKYDNEDIDMAGWASSAYAARCEREAKEKLNGPKA